MANFLEQKRTEIDNRLAELRPLLDEYNRLQVAADALGSVTASVSNGATTTAPGRRGPGRPRGSKTRTSAATRSAATSTRRGGRRAGTGKRAVQTLAAITEQPGITVPELVRKMKVNQTYLYRVLPGLQKEGKIVKQGRGWHPKG